MPFRPPIKPKNLLDRPWPQGAPAGFSIEFAMVRSSAQRFDCVLSIVVWCGVPSHHQYLKTQPLSVGFFSARRASIGAVAGLGLFSGTPLPTPVSGPFGPVFSLCSLSGSLPENASYPAKTRGCACPVAFFVCWGRRDRECTGRKKAARRRRVVKGLAISFWSGSSCAAAASPAAGRHCGSGAPVQSRCRRSGKPQRRPEPDAPTAQSCWPAQG